MIASFLVKMSLIAAHCVWSSVELGADGQLLRISTLRKASRVRSSAAGVMSRSDICLT